MGIMYLQVQILFLLMQVGSIITFIFHDTASIQQLPTVILLTYCNYVHGDFNSIIEEGKHARVGLQKDTAKIMHAGLYCIICVQCKSILI